MPVLKTKRSTSAKKSSVKKTAGLSGLADFISKLDPDAEPVKLQQQVAEYAEKATVTELLFMPIDDNGHLIKSKTNGYEEELVEKTAAAVSQLINTVLKNRKHLKDLRTKGIRSRLPSPIIPLEYPKKTYKTKYLLRRKVIK